MNPIVLYSLLTLYALSILGVILVIISENRNPLKSVPWVIVLMFAPIIGLVVYFFFGQNLSKRRNITRRARKQLDAYLADEERLPHPPIDPELEPLRQLIINGGHAAPLYHTDITVYTDGASKMQALMEAIASAKHHIHLLYYIIDSDRTGEALRELLIRKAKEGVKVRVLYDDVGSRSVRKRFFREMQDAGVEVYEFLHVKFPRFTSKVNYRNHRKIVVIDGRIGFFGGMNIADRYIYGSPLGPWRDTHFSLQGGGVVGLQAIFLNDWYVTTRQRIELQGPYQSHTQGHSNNVMQIMQSGPFGKWRTQLQAICMAIGRARKRIWIQTPYYLPSDALNNALQTAALAGLDVRLMLPERSDSRIVDLAAHSYLDDMLRAGVKVSFYMAGFLHSKLMIIDDRLTIVGSANLDFRSFEHNFEVNGYIYGAEFATRMASIYEQDSTQCRRIAASEWFRRSRWVRLSESLMRLFSPLL